MTAPGPGVANIPLLVLGAGPFGLGVAAWAAARGRDFLLLGRPMSFWREHMPPGMLLRSGLDWHFDPDGRATMYRYLAERGLAQEAVLPLTIDTFVGYAEWFRERKELEPDPAMVVRLDRVDDEAHPFRAVLGDGRTVAAGRVVLAPGFRHFAHVPSDLAARLPPGRYDHTCDLVDFRPLRGRRCLIIGGRQGALEWAALMREAGAAAVHVAHRHPTPAFAEADWSWVGAMVDAMVEDPGWFRRLDETEKEAIRRRFWTEGRLKVEPWLEARLAHGNVRLLPGTEVMGVDELASGALRVRFDDAATIDVDHISLATGYRPDVARLPYLAAGNILQQLAIVDGCPVLDERFQTSVPGLFITSMPAVQAFGPFLAFTVSVRASSLLIGQALAGGGG